MFRIEPDSLVNYSDFGSTVGVSGNQVVVLNWRDPVAPPRSDGGVIKVYRRAGFEWQLMQNLIAPDSSGRDDFFDFIIEDNAMAARSSSGVYLFERSGDAWIPNPAQPMLDVPYARLIDMADDLLIISRSKTVSGERQTVYEVLEKRGATWEERRPVTRIANKACVAGNNILQASTFVSAPADTLFGIPETEAGAVFVAERRDTVWAVVDTVVVPGNSRLWLACDEDEAAVIGGRVDDESQTLSILKRGDDNHWRVTHEVDATAKVTGVMSVVLHNGSVYMGQEFRVPKRDTPEGYVTQSNILVYARGDDSWEYIRSIRHPDAIDPSWEDNDGCIGAAIAVNDDYLVASAPVRKRRVGDVIYERSGEVFIFGKASIDPRAEPVVVVPRYDLVWSHVYPNPGRGRLTAKFDLPESANVKAVVFDALGRLVATLEDGNRQRGPHILPIDTVGWSSGVYFLRVTVNYGSPAVQSFVVRSS